MADLALAGAGGPGEPGGPGGLCGPVEDLRPAQGAAGGRLPALSVATWGECRLSLVRFPTESYLFLDELGRFGRVARVSGGREPGAEILIGAREDLDAGLLYKHLGAALGLPGLVVFDGLRRRKYPELRGLLAAAAQLLRNPPGAPPPAP